MAVFYLFHAQEPPAKADLDGLRKSLLRLDLEKIIVGLNADGEVPESIQMSRFWIDPFMQSQKEHPLAMISVPHSEAVELPPQTPQTSPQTRSKKTTLYLLPLPQIETYLQAFEKPFSPRIADLIVVNPDKGIYRSLSFLPD